MSNYKIKKLLTILGDVAKFDITIGVTEQLPVDCLFVLKDKELYDRVEAQVQHLDELPYLFKENLTTEELIASLLGTIGKSLNLIINLSYNMLLDRDCLILFQSATLVDLIYNDKI